MKTLRIAFSFVFLFGYYSTVYSQAVSGIVTDFNSYWKSSVSQLNPSKPVNSHNLLAFTYNGVQYSTGANDLLLTAHGEHFVAGDFWSLPVEVINGQPTGNTKVGMGQLKDGVHNGASPTPPAFSLATYLTDGIKGLDLGTCVANLPAGDLNFLVNTINPSFIGDGIPDILVTQIADPSGSTDSYNFKNSQGQQVGMKKDIVFTSITPVGTWTADFYEASATPRILTPTYTNTDRPLRLWAADLSEFGITAANHNSVSKFSIHLSGNSDVAFVAYNNKTFSISSLLPVVLQNFSGKMQNNQANLQWNTASAENLDAFVVERSENAMTYKEIGKVDVMPGTTGMNSHQFTDRSVTAGNNYYRLRIVENDGTFRYSNIINLQRQITNVRAYPNPASEFIAFEFPGEEGNRLLIYRTDGSVIGKYILTSGSNTINVSGWTKGVYQAVTATNRISFVVK